MVYIQLVCFVLQISVDEVGEPADSPVSDSGPESYKLKVPGTKNLRSESSRLHGTGRETVSKEIPEWVTKLSAKYNMKVFKDYDLN